MPHSQTTTAATNTKPRRWVAWVVGILLALFVLGMVAWIFIKAFIETKIQQQLADLNLGRTSIGNISISPNGLTAHNIEFQASPNDDRSPWLTVGRMEIQHPLSELAAGATTFNGIQLNHAQATLDLDDLPFANAGDSANFQLDLSQFQLPAQRVSVTQSNLRITQGQQTLDISGADLTLEQNGDAQTVSGQVTDLIGGQWKIEGQIEPQSNRYQATLRSQNFDLKNESWQSLPLVPSNLHSYLTVSGAVDVLAEISGTGQTPVMVDGTATIQNLDLNLPSFDLPITITSGDVKFDLQQINATKVAATIDGQDRINASGTVNISDFPIMTDFKTDFRQVSIESLRRIVPAIPEILSARATGVASGQIWVDRDTQTTITIDADGRTESASYGNLTAESSHTTVAIDSLVFDAQQNYQSIAGTIAVEAQAARQPIENIFSTFEIQSLSQQLDLKGSVNGSAKLKLPLATIADLKTWALTIDGQMPKGNLGGQRIADARVAGRLSGGQLELSPVTATAILKDAPPKNSRVAKTAGDAPAPQPLASSVNTVTANIRWPLVDEAPALTNPNTQPNTPANGYHSGTVALTGSSVPAQWAVGLIQNQIFNATGEHPIKETSDLARQVAEIGGTVNFGATINIPVAQPDDISQWSVNGSVFDSKLTAQQQSLNNLSSNIAMADGKLNLANVTGDFQGGGQVTGQATIDLTEAATHQIDMEARKAPLFWLVAMGKNANADFAAQFNRIAGLKDGQPLTPEIVAGNLDVAVDFQTDPADAQMPWSAKINVKSQEVVFLGETFKKLDIAAGTDPKNLTVSRLNARFGVGGSIDGKLNWDLQQNTGDGDLNWQSLSIQKLTQIAGVDGIQVTGRTDGRLNLASVDQHDEDFEPDTIPIKIDGQITAVDLTAGKIRAKPFRFDIATRSGALLVENFRTENKAIDIDVAAQAELKPPYRFNAKGRLGKLQLSQLLKQSSVTQKEGEVVDVSGVMSGNFALQGQLFPQEIRTNGNIKIASPSYHNKQYQDIKVDWDHLGNNWEQSTLRIDAFGGVIEMVELTRVPQRIGVDVKAIDAAEVTSLFNLPIDLTGQLEGSASINDWDIAETRWAELELHGSSLLVSETKIGNFTGTADYRDDKLSYGIFGALLGGAFKGEGETAVGTLGIEEIEFPITFTLTNALLGKLNRKSPALRQLRNLDGNLSALATFVVGLDRPFEGDGRIAVTDAKWSNEILTRSASIHFNVDQERLLLNDVQADLKRGRINASAMIPLNSNLAGSYQCDIRQMDLQRIAAVATQSPVDVEGLFDARFNGQIGTTLSGQGYLGVERASLQGVNGQSIRLPVQFFVSTTSGSGRLELRQSNFRLFDGTASGTAKLSFGTRTSVDADLKLTRIDTGKMMRSLADFDQADQGELNGRLKIKGSNLRSLRDLKGTFTGELQRASAFQFPVLADMARLLAGNQLQNDSFNSENIRLQLDNGRVEVKSLNFASPLANIAITGFMFVDGRLDLSVAGRIERFNQPTLLEELAGSPLTLIRGTPASLLAQAADFISDRVVFLKVGGTARRPQVRVDTRQQLREETIRYFLRGSQILPTSRLGNN